MKLYGSLASPFVRRIRMALNDKDFTFEIINIFDQEQSKIIESLNPTKRIPLLVDGENVIWDSLLIYEYLQGELSLNQKKEILLINEATDAGVSLFQLRKFDIDPNDKSLFSINNLKRIELILTYFNDKNLSDPLIQEWLFMTLDWFKFRDVYKWEDQFNQLNEFYKNEYQKEKYQSTDPRN